MREGIRRSRPFSTTAKFETILVYARTLKGKLNKNHHNKNISQMKELREEGKEEKCAQLLNGK